MGGVPFYKSKFLVSFTRTCQDHVGRTTNSTVTTCADGTAEHTEDEGLGVNICCSSASALCKTGNNDGKSWNFPLPLSERNSAGRTGQPRTLSLRGAARKQRETRRRGRWNIRVLDRGTLISLLCFDFGAFSLEFLMQVGWPCCFVPSSDNKTLRAPRCMLFVYCLKGTINIS